MNSFRNDKQHIEYMAITMTSVIMFLALMAMFIGEYPWSTNDYNSYTLQAVSWLHGHLDLGHNYEHLELAIYNGKYYVSFPPFPSYVMLPFALIFGEKTPDYLILYIVDLIGAFYLYKIAAFFKLKPFQCMISTFFCFLGSNLIFILLRPSVWFVAQTMCFTLSIMSIYFAMNCRYSLALALWACAVGCRPMQVIFIVPIIVVMYVSYIKNNDNDSFVDFARENIYSVFPMMIIGVSYMALNYARFGNALQFGHDYLPEFTRSEFGQFSFSYIPNNFISMFRSFRFEDDGRMLIDHYNNLSMLIISPIFLVTIVLCIVAIINTIRRKSDKLYILNEYEIYLLICTFIASAGYIIIILMHKTLGGWHFGNRYSNDIIPYIYLLLIMVTSKKARLIKWEIPFLIYALVLNSVGTVIVYNGLG